MGLIRSIPLKDVPLKDGPNDSNQYAFLKQVDFETLRMQMAARDLTKPAAGELAPNKLAHFIGMQDNRNRLQGILNGSRRDNAWITGAKGIGKTCVVEDYLRRVAIGKVDAKLGSKPTFVFDVNDFFALPREKWVELFEASMKKVAEQKGLIVIDHMDDFVATADGEAARLISTFIKHLERKEEVQAIIVSEPTGEMAIEKASSGVTRRFQKLRLNKEPDDKTLKEILISHFKTLEQGHNVNFSEDTADEMIRLLRRYPGRAFTGMQPASALEFADAVACYVRSNQFAPPLETIEMEERLSLMQDRMDMLATDGEKAKEQREALAKEIEALTNQREAALTEWNEKFAPVIRARKLYEEINHKIALLKQKTSRSRAEETSFSTLTANLDQARENVEIAEKAIYSEAPLVEAKHVRATFGLAANLPLSKLHEDKRTRLAKLLPYLDTQIFKQDKAKTVLASIYRQRERGTSDPSRPAGIVLFAGGTGLGKTELFRALTRFDLGLEDRPDLADQIEPIVVELSQFQSAADVSSLKGAAPGLIGYDETPKLLTEVRNNPRGLVLFDEGDKAHPSMFDLLMQVLENGKLTDSHGVDTNFKDTIIGICINGITAKDFEPGEMDNDGVIREKIKGAKSQSKEANGMKLFREEFINRIDAIVIFEDLGPEELQKILNGEVRKLNSAYRDAGISIEADESTRQAIVEHWPIPASGGRAPRQIAKKYIRPVLDARQDERENSVTGEEVLPPEHFELKFDGEKITLDKIGEYCPLPPPVAAKSIKRPELSAK